MSIGGKLKELRIKSNMTQEELGEKCTVVATGGLSVLVAPLCKREIILDDDLLLKGLMYIYSKNCEE